MGPRFPLILLIALGGGAITACAALLSIGDVAYGAGDAAAESGSLDAEGGRDADGAVDADAAPTCIVEPPDYDPGGSPLATCAGIPGIDLSQSKDNCGRCGHVCVSSACSAGVCTPTILANLDSNTDRSIFVEGGYLYWSSTRTVSRLPVGAGAPAETLFVLDVPDGGDPTTKISDLLAAPDRFWIRERFALVSVLRDGGDRRDFGPAGEPFEPVIVEPTSLAYGAGDYVVRVPMDGGGATPIAREPLPARAFARGLNQLFWVTAREWVTAPGAVDAGGGQLRTELSGPRAVVEDAGRPYHLVEDGARLYFSDTLTGQIFSVPFAATAFDAPSRVAVAPGYPSVLALAVDATHVYWLAQSPGEIDRARLFRRLKCGVGPVQVVQHEVVAPLALIAPDGPYLYYVAAFAVWRLSK